MNDSEVLFYRHIDNSECGYLPNLESNSIFIDPESKPTKDQLNLLHLQGFRRSGKLVYRPHCPDCNACQSCRIINPEFRASKNQKKAIKRNQDVSLHWSEAAFNNEHYQLYQRYINQRHQDGEMFPASEEQYQGFLIEGHGTHRFLELRDAEGTLIGCCVVDVFYDGLSAIYSYFDPDQPRRSLGRYIVLALISECQQQGLPYTYLGYWIKNANKMSYKADYQPLEVFDGEFWRKLVIK